MAERNSEYTRIAGDDYATPGWVTKALLDVDPYFPGPIWECAPGDGHMVRTLQERGHTVAQTSMDFLSSTIPLDAARSIITNPPYVLATQFIRHALQMMMPRHGKVAMLLPMAFDCAGGRRDLFGECKYFSAKYVLTKRIRWANIEQKAAGPSQNHAWFVWDWAHTDLPTIGYLPIERLGV